MGERKAYLDDRRLDALRREPGKRPLSSAQPTWYPLSSDKRLKGVV